MHYSIKRLTLITLLLLAKVFSAQTDSIPTFDKLHYNLLADYLVFTDTMEKKPITDSYFRVRAHTHISILDFNDGKNTYAIHKKIRVYKSGTRYEEIKWFMIKGSFYHKLYVIKTIGQDYRYIKQYSYNAKWKMTKKLICIDDNYLQVHVYRPRAARSIKTYLKHESSLPGSHQN